ncbi:hypothetical protein [Thermoflexus sp.]|uniref:hypothetical protein n=1 Tax=Thermoflexus sp. TaxID=1969742 RepID=UPI0035E4214B
MKRRAFLQDGTIALAYALWSILLTAPLIFRMADALPQDLGDPLLNTWILAWETRALVERPGAFFDAPIFYPHRGTLAYSEPLLGILPFAFPFILGTGIPALGYNMAFLFSFWIAALGMARLVRAWGGSRRAAFVAGWLFAAAPYRFAHLMHLQLLYAGWIPIAMAALIRYLRRPTWRRVFDLLLSLLLMMLSSWHLAVFGGLALAFLGLWGLREQPLLPPALKKMALVILLGGLLIGSIAVPYFRVAPELARHRDLQLAQEFAAWPIDGLAAAPLLRILGPLTAPFRIPGHTTHEVQLYPGLAPLLMAAIALRASSRGWARALQRMAWVCLGLGAAMALGPRWTLGPIILPGLYTGMATLFPGVTLIRAIARWFLLALIGLHGLAGIGLAEAFRSLRRRAMPLALGILGLGILEAWAVPLPLAPLPRPSALPPVYRWLAQQPGTFAVVELPVLLPLDADETMRMYAALVHGKPLIIAYSGYIPPDIRELRERLRTFPSREAREALAALRAIGVRYVLVDESKPELHGFSTTGICEVSRDPHFMPVIRMEPYWVFELIEPSRKWGDPPELRSIRIPFGRVAVLRGYGVRWLSETEAEVWLEWEAGTQPAGSYSITVQAFDSEKEKIAQHDGPPLHGGYPFLCWEPGERIMDVRRLSAGGLRQARWLGIGIYEWPSLKHLPAPCEADRIGDLILLPLSGGP